MVNYLPEKIYEVLKDNKEYLEIEQTLKDTMFNVNSLKEFNDFCSTNNDDEIVPDTIQKIINLIQDLCPEYELEYRMACGFYDRDELQKIYANLNEYNYRVRLLCLSEIENLSYVDRTYLKYKQQFVDLYELVEDKSELTEYCHLKYFRNKIVKYITSIPEFTYSDIDTVYNYILNEYNNILQYTTSDTLNNETTETMNIVLSEFTLRVDNIEYAFILGNKFYEWITNTEFQYKDYSFGVANILVKLSRIAASNRDFTSFINITRELSNYVNNALADVKTLYKGLHYYDKTNYTMFVNIIRWCIRLASIPIIKNHKICLLSNLSQEDYEYVMSDIRELNKKIYGKKLHTGSDRYYEDINNWFSPNNEAFNLLSSLEV